MIDDNIKTGVPGSWWHPRRAAARRRAVRMWVLLAVLLVLSAAVAQSVPRADAEQRAQAQGQSRSLQGWPPWDPSWPPLPPSPVRPPRPMVDVLGAYAFAVRQADMLQYIPCYCGCGRVGHRSNVGCYVKDGQAKGAPQWDLHAYT